jgi:hypothetical protein
LSDNKIYALKKVRSRGIAENLTISLLKIM